MVSGPAVRPAHEGGSPDLHLMRDVVLYPSEFGGSLPSPPCEDAAFERMVASFALKQMANALLPHFGGLDLDRFARALRTCSSCFSSCFAFSWEPPAKGWLWLRAPICGRV